jgi:hypothetical protein
MGPATKGLKIVSNDRKITWRSFVINDFNPDSNNNENIQ